MNVTDLIPALPEIIVLTMICLVLVVDLFVSEHKKYITYGLTQLTLIAGFLATAYLYLQNPGATELAFFGTFVRDPLSDFLKLYLYLMACAVFLYSRDYLKEQGIPRGEYYILGLFAVLGMMVMISAYSFLNLYLGLEMLSLSLYALIALNRNSKRAAEAAMKYFVLGAIASGMLLYGISIYYGLTSSIDFGSIAAATADLSDNKAAYLGSVFGLVFICIGIAFKLGAVPFHLWLPDVYEGAPASVTLFIGTLPKLAAFALIFRVLVEGLNAQYTEWRDILIILSVLSLFLGNVVAIMQTNIKRMLAYSTISHVGFIMMGMLSGYNDGYAASMFYTITYVLTALSALGMIVLMSQRGVHLNDIKDLAGLNEKSPWIAFLMMITLFSMAGVPPTVGFYAKLVVLQSLVEVGMMPLVIFAVMMSVVGAFYYLRVIKTMYFDKSDGTFEITRFKPDAAILISVNGLLLLFLGLVPGLIQTCQSILKLY